MNRFDLLAIGNLTLDVIHDVDKIPNIDETGIVENKKTYFGGRAGNLAVLGSKLGLKVAIASVVGGDFLDSGYREYLVDHNIDIERIEVFEKDSCARIIVFKREDGKHIYFFEPNIQRVGRKLVLNKSELSEFSLVYLTSLDSERTISHLFNKLSGFDKVFFEFGEEIYRKSTRFLESAINISSYIHLNALEYEILSEKLGFSSVSDVFESVQQLKFLCISSGKKGTVIHTRGAKYKIPAIRPLRLISTLGAGDAYVVGLIFGILNNWSLIDSGRMGSVLSSFILEFEGAQKMIPEWELIMKRFRKNFGELPQG